MPAIAIDGFEGSESHDEIINKLDGNGQESSIDVVVPPGVDYEILFRGLHIVRIEDDLAEVDVGDKSSAIEGNIPKIVGTVDHLGIDVEFDRVARLAPDPQTGHEYHNVVAGEGLCESSELTARRLSSVVDCVCIVGQVVHLGCDIYLHLCFITMSPAV